MKKVFIALGLISFGTALNARTHKIYNATPNNIVVHLDLVAARDERKIIKPGKMEKISVTAPLRAIEVRGLGEHTAGFKARKLTPGVKPFGRTFYIYFKKPAEKAGTMKELVIEEE